MYHQYFGLSEQPFSIAVNPRYLFMSARHRDALAHLLYGVGTGGGFILLTGEVGTGKTTLNRSLIEQLPSATDIAIVLNPALSAAELLASVCDELAIDYQAGTDSLKVLTDALHQFLLDNHAKNRRTVLMIDEAQHLSFDVLEQIRLLTNLETDEKKLLQIILIGQPELEATLSRPELRQLNQRITARFKLTPLDREETGVYIRHRLQVAGLQGKQTLFSAAAQREVYRVSGGIPRLINLVCDRALTGAYGRHADAVSPSLVREAAREVLGEAQFANGRGDRVAGRTNARHTLMWIALPIAALIIYIASDFGASVRPDWLALDQQEAVHQPGQTAAKPTSDPTNPGWQLEPDRAERAFWALWSESPLLQPLCDAIALKGWRCETGQAAVWDSLLELDRPVLLALRRADGFAASSVLLDIRADRALVWNGLATCETPLRELAASWLGTYQYVWKSPPGWKGPLILGDTGPSVTHVVEAFAELDGLPAPPLEVFTPALEQRVRLFQASRGLSVDGVIGERTLQALNDSLGRQPSVLPQISAARRTIGGEACL